MTSASTPSPTPPSTPTVYEAARLRSAGLADVAALAALYQRAWPEAGETRETVQDWLEQGGALVLEDAQGTLVCALRWREAENGWRVDRVATLPEERAQGFGRWLMTKLEALAIQRNIPTLHLHLSEAQADLLPYYRRMGYRTAKSEGESDGILSKRVGGTWQYQG